jgi:hypothetical protein
VWDCVSGYAEERPDYRSERMESPEGKGIARARWEASPDGIAGKRVGGDEGIHPLVRRIAAPVLIDLTGFWVMWHLRGGFEGLRATGLSRSSIYRRISNFRTATGMHPDEYVFPGINLDLAEYQAREIPD